MTLLRFKAVSLLVCLMGFNSCSHSSVSTGSGGDLDADSGENPGIPLVSVGTFTDRRERGGDPSDEFVESAFSDALEKRGMLAKGGDGNYEISGSILDLDTSRWIRPHASVRIRVRVSSRRGGVTLHTGVYDGDHRLEGIPMWSPSAIGKADEAGKIALAKAIDTALEDPRLRRVLIY